MFPSWSGNSKRNGKYPVQTCCKNRGQCSLDYAVETYKDISADGNNPGTVLGGIRGMSEDERDELREYLAEFHNRSSDLKDSPIRIPDSPEGMSSYQGELGLVWMTPFVRRPKSG